jgi:hypothetical protein
MLLSFWDYLRRRSAESVLLGIQDALAAAERPSTEAAISELVMQLEIAAVPPEQSGEPRQLPLSNIQPSESENPPPRRRGRPRKHPTTP